MNALLRRIDYAIEYSRRRPPLLYVCDSAADGDAQQDSPPSHWPPPEDVTDWLSVHERIEALGVERAMHEREVCRWLLAAERLAVHACVGHSSLREYAHRALGLTPRQTKERLRVGHALPRLPLLDAALADGGLCFSAVRELTRVVEPDTEKAWLDWADRRTVRQIERAVAERVRGDGPDAAPDPARVRHRLSFEVRAETMALFRDLQATVRADLGGGGGGGGDGAVDDDTLLFEIARRALGGPTDDGRAGYQVAVTRCDACGLAAIDAAGHGHPVDETVDEMMACDSQQLGRLVAHVGGEPEAHVGRDGGTHVGPPRVAVAERATQTIPPRIRRQVIRRDRGHCVVPGCRNHRFLDVHHVVARSEGGQHDPNTMATVCGTHHLAIHRGWLCVQGTAATGLSFRHADGTPYGGRLRPAEAHLAPQVFDALTQLGFKQTRARELIDAVQAAGAPEELRAFIHAALRAS